MASDDKATTVSASIAELWGIVNVTPDSFSDGGQSERPEQATGWGLHLARCGADVVDVGGASSRPRGDIYGKGAVMLAPEIETLRVLPVVQALCAAGCRVSIDTIQASVAEAALGAGASIVNDVSCASDARLLQTVAAHDAGYVLMHRRGDGATVGKDAIYDDIIESVLAELDSALARVLAAGIRRERVWLDPGLGFSKDVETSRTLLRGLERLRVFGLPVVVGASRKAFLGMTTPSGAIIPAHERDPASYVAACLAVACGATAMRVHDVAGTRQALLAAELLTGTDSTMRRFLRSRDSP